ncbi:hypothetical protein RB653_008271 [Dictyostelium firmibasis]|uniref:Glycine cleavage system H protein n=1 Tax=Dictyostelium firmibasis TaxID=79012 RepID=A0AAN7YP75_9MYCE
MLKTLTRVGTQAFNKNLFSFSRNYCTRYTTDHEWVNNIGPKKYKLGITDFAQKQMGDIVYIELPKIGDSFEKGGEMGTIESVKAVSEYYIPIDGKITSANDKITEEPEILNEDPYGEGWLVEFESDQSGDFSELMSKDQYDKYIKDQN